MLWPAAPHPERCSTLMRTVMPTGCSTRLLTFSTGKIVLVESPFRASCLASVWEISVSFVLLWIIGAESIHFRCAFFVFAAIRATFGVFGVVGNFYILAVRVNTAIRFVGR